MLPQQLSEYGSVTIFTFILIFFIALLLSLPYVHFSHEHFGASGAAYQYSKRYLTPALSFLIVWNDYLGYNITCTTAVATSFAGYFTSLFTASPRSWQSALAAVFALSLTLAAQLLGRRALKVFQEAITVVKFIPIVAVGLGGVFFIDAANLGGDNFNTTLDTDEPLSAFGAIANGVRIAMWSVMGFESAAKNAGEVANPAASVPFATVGGILFCSALYLLVTVTCMGIIPPVELRHSTAPLLDAAAAAWGDWAGVVIGVAALLSCLGSILGNRITVIDYLDVATAEGMFFSPFSRRVDDFSWVTSVVAYAVGVVLIAVCYMGGGGTIHVFEVFLSVNYLACIVSYLVAALADVARIAQNDRFGAGDACALARNVVYVAALVAVFAFMLYYTDALGLFSGLVLELLGLVFFFGYVRPFKLRK